MTAVSNYWYLEKQAVGSRPQARYRHASTVIGGSIFIFGGINKEQRKFNDLYEYNVARKEWRLVQTCGTIPSPRTFHQIASVNNKI